LKDQVLFDSWKTIFEDIEETQQLATKTCKKLWNSSDDLLEGFGMQVMQRLDEATPSELRIAEVETQRDLNKKVIDQIKEVNKEILSEYLMKPTRLITLTKYYLKRIQQDIKLEIASRICDGELQVEKMQLSRIDVVLKKFELWKAYRDNIESNKTS
jgi:hypothetical protein